VKPPRPWVRLSIAAALLFAAFSYVATRAITSGHWPELPPGALRDVDLWAGLAFLLLFVGLLLFRKDRRQKAEGGRQ
jgi:hypothetical protein